jgi:putative flippase GtrA
MPESAPADPGVTGAAPRPAGLPSLLRYAAVGVVATLAHYAVLVAAVEGLHWPAWFASGFGAVVGAQVAYAGNRWFTFAHRGAVARSWPRFQATAALGALFGMAIVALAVRIGVHYLIGQVVATLAAMLVTYAVNRWWTFATTPHRG